MKITILLTAILILLLSCKDVRKRLSNQQLTTHDKKSAETFEAFNSRFHSDSAFQLMRISFPLEGKQIDGFEQKGWTLGDWEMMKMPVGAPVDTFEYKRSLQQTDSSVSEAIWISESGFRVDRTFKLRKGKWFLTFYNDINL